MIVAFSTSSPLSSVALIDDGQVLIAKEEWAPQGASGASLRMLEQALKERGRALREAKLFLADLGPGSFTGVKVGVTLAKAFAFAVGAKCAGASSFDLIAPDRDVVLPSKKGEFFSREPGSTPRRVESLPDSDFVGFGPGIEPATYPLAERFIKLWEKLQAIEPEALVPQYLVEPSTSLPKKPFRVTGAAQ
jgi:tRNA threonylcarbamoyladenosine biosynthesis protein TsaB